MGLALVALIANQVSLTLGDDDKQSTAALMGGYRASFWLLFAMCGTSIGGLRKIEKVSGKND